ncbi:formyltetrahydrofolate deformylase [Nonomuraea cavernae]|uniref:Formyltetrahydrofolate deformylase n=1 Tax=Nonomuraea cavernae TaxID=2045107 RepID=A0A917Z977_9ACTN|nr:formyltetrahydrofolate deformylase [Nonomuraea cavernae]MCA2190203.1 formyltetrahydrofolate deformylase [Nonomuraea cavernae]GGO78746.1 formyltetrahydrofolate deformylase [Nonomuraea cavernae]
MTSAEYVLTLSCPDRPGVVAAVSGLLAGHGGNIIESQQFGDRVEQRFFMRVQFASPLSEDELRAAFAALAPEFGMEFELRDVARRPRVLIMVSRFGHCLNDLLYRVRSGSLDIEIVAVASNHPDLRPLTQSYGVDYHHLPISPETKARQEAEVLALVEHYQVDLVVLARYMQVLSEDLCAKLAGRAINIHHSFLPSFKGAKPYHQAHNRGVKLIGATAHYVTSHLDEGPIIEQEVARVNHSHSPDDLAAIGRDVECVALARAVRWHCEQRVLLDGHKTIVFPR